MKLYVIKLNALHKFALIGVFTLVLCIGIFVSRETVVEVFQQKRDLPIYSVECESKKASITFDCAWGADDIPHIVNTLKEHNVRASFFFVGDWAEKYPDMVKLIYDNGHDVANHSYAHLRMGTIDNTRIRPANCCQVFLRKKLKKIIY